MDLPQTIWHLFSLDQIPLWLKISFTLFVSLLVPVYWTQYGPVNFLWFSDIALLLTVPALWLESGLLASKVYRLGYDNRALIAQTLVAWIILPLSYLLSKPSENVNWVYGFGSQPQTLMPPRLYLALIMVLFPLAIYLPSHFLLKGLFG